MPRLNGQHPAPGLGGTAVIGEAVGVHAAQLLQHGQPRRVAVGQSEPALECPGHGRVVLVAFGLTFQEVEHVETIRIELEYLLVKADGVGTPVEAFGGDLRHLAEQLDLRRSLFGFGLTLEQGVESGPGTPFGI